MGESTTSLPFYIVFFSNHATQRDFSIQIHVDTRGQAFLFFFLRLVEEPTEAVRGITIHVHYRERERERSLYIATSISIYRLTAPFQSPPSLPKREPADKDAPQIKPKTQQLKHQQIIFKHEARKIAKKKNKNKNTNKSGGGGANDDMER